MHSYGFFLRFCLCSLVQKINPSAWYTFNSRIYMFRADSSTAWPPCSPGRATEFTWTTLKFISHQPHSNFSWSLPCPIRPISPENAPPAPPLSHNHHRPSSTSLSRLKMTCCPHLSFSLTTVAHFFLPPLLPKSLYPHPLTTFTVTPPRSYLALHLLFSPTMLHIQWRPILSSLALRRWA